MRTSTPVVFRNAIGLTVRNFMCVYDDVERAWSANERQCSVSLEKTDVTIVDLYAYSKS